VIISVLREMVQGFIANAGAHPGRKREAEDNSRKIGALFWRANASELPAEVLNKLRSLSQAIQAGNTQDATAIQVRALLMSHLMMRCPQPALLCMPPTHRDQGLAAVMCDMWGLG
jgi:hypothetical protein